MSLFPTRDIPEQNKSLLEGDLNAFDEMFTATRRFCNSRQYMELDLDSRMNYLILINREHRLEDKYAALVQELARIFCGHRGGDSKAWWQDRQQLKTRVKQIEAESVAYLVCRRKGLISNAAKYLKEYQTQNRELPVLGFTGVLQAASYIEGMGKSKWKKPKKTR